MSPQEPSRIQLERGRGKDIATEGEIGKGRLTCLTIDGLGRRRRGECSSTSAREMDRNQLIVQIMALHCRPQLI